MTVNVDFQTRKKFRDPAVFHYEVVAESNEASDDDLVLPEKQVRIFFENKFQHSVTILPRIMFFNDFRVEDLVILFHLKVRIVSFKF